MRSSVLLEPGEQRIGRRHLGEFIPQIRCRHACDLGRRDDRAIHVSSVEGVRRVDDEVNVVAKISGDPRCRLAAVVSRDAADHESVESALPQPMIEIRLAVEGRVDL